MVNTWLGDMTRLHILRLNEALGALPHAASEAFTGLTHYMGQITPDPARAATMADAVMSRVVAREALTLAFDDVFRLMAYLFLATLVMVPFCKPPKLGVSAPVDAH
jgi:DHA2 family multidrug resistance protein